jgi:hypothetical protein
VAHPSGEAARFERVAPARMPSIRTGAMRRPGCLWLDSHDGNQFSRNATRAN